MRGLNLDLPEGAFNSGYVLHHNMSHVTIIDPDLRLPLSVTTYYL